MKELMEYLLSKKYIHIKTIQRKLIHKNEQIAEKN